MTPSGRSPRAAAIAQPPTPTAQAVAEAGAPNGTLLRRVLDAGEAFALGLGRVAGPGVSLLFEFLRRVVYGV